ncbi:MAG: isocitrate/isopropylmalate family dehydrogenase [Ferroplasma sp.]|uniref:isocitrate/isopropylmalate family dehydrogenase n=1 Tax=Ferroplasma sp. TaxID=2591003 RepID=UPI00281590E2|nr:isocitrate/isopropylmalate family dehydrogenase [Ferroplasma sp.]WMT51723.1 MAG: isocitrate/isopropylmalate family dehydrogenase [Ferroplasma sp.]
MAHLMYVKFTDAGMVVPDMLTVGYIEGDGIGPEITGAMIDVINSAIELAYGGSKSIEWRKILIGNDAYEKFGIYIPDESINEIQKTSIVMKSTLNLMPDNRDINTILRKRLGLYANLRMVKYIPGMEILVKSFDRINITVIRNSFASNHVFYHSSESTDDLIKFISENYDLTITPDSGIYMFSQSKFRTLKVVKQAVNYYKKYGHKKITVVDDRENPEFGQWCYDELQRHDGIEFEMIKTREFMKKLVAEPESLDILLMDTVLSRFVLDFLTGAVNIEYGASLGDECSLFEAVQSSSPLEAGYDAADPLSFILSGCSMLRHIGWIEPADIIERAITAAFLDNKIPRDLTGRQDVTPVKCSEFSSEIIKRMEKQR